MKILVEFDSLDEAAEFILWRDGRLAPVKGSCEGNSKTPIRDAGLMVRTENCLAAEGFDYLEDAQAESNSRLMKIPNFGRKSLRDLREAKPNAEFSGRP